MQSTLKKLVLLSTMSFMANGLLAIPVLGDTLVFPKPPFKDRHPHVYSFYRGARHVVIMTEPFLRAAGSLAQIGSYFKR